MNFHHFQVKISGNSSGKPCVDYQPQIKTKESKGVSMRQAVSYYRLSADERNHNGASHYAICLHYRIGTESDLFTGSVYHEKSSQIKLRAVRCRRSLRKSQFENRDFSELSNQWLLFFDNSPFERPLRLTSDCAIDWLRVCRLRGIMVRASESTGFLLLVILRWTANAG
jgi:hypothetical protein